MIKVLVVGSRDWWDYRTMSQVLHEVITTLIQASGDSDIEIISGGAKGADLLARRYSREYFHKYRVFLADWNGNGKRAGFIRNKDMVDYGPDYCVAFRMNRSKGTTHTIELCRRKKIPTRVVDRVNRNKQHIWRGNMDGKTTDRT